MSDTLAVALVGGLVGGVIAALVGGVITLVAQGRQHRHERDVARDARLQERRGTAYERIMGYAYRLDLWVERTEPVMGPKPEPPEVAADDELIALNAITAIHASPEVQELVTSLSATARTFQADVWLLRFQREHPHPIDESINTWDKVEKDRVAFRDAVRALAERTNEELRG